MSKKSKQERKAEREAQRAAVRRAERQRNIFTGIVIGIVVLLGGVLVWLSVADDSDEFADLLDELEAAAEDEDEDSPGLDDEVDDRPIACGAAEPQAAGEEKATFDGPADVLADDVEYQAVIDTSCGRLVLALDAEGAPENVNSFVFLAELGFFDGLEIFRHAQSINALQTGAGTNDASWQIGYTLPDELETAATIGYPAGTVAMANAGPDSAGSQFFFVYGGAFDESIETGGLMPSYTRLGEVVEGLDVLGVIAEIPVDGETPQERVYMEQVVIVTGDGELPPEPDRPAEPEADPTPDPTPEADATDEPDADATDEPDQD